MKGQLETIKTNVIQPAQAAFEDMALFRREAEFAMQAFRKNKFLMDTALRNPQSAIDAVANVANFGLSLNPAKKEAYLVPRDGGVMLDPSYMGLLKSSFDDGCIELGICECVHASDGFEENIFDPSKPPKHTRNRLLSDEDRGPIIGAYATLKLNKDNWYTKVINKDEIEKIRMKNEAEKKGRYSSWKDWYSDMACKSVLKKALKFTKGSGKTANIIEYMNTDGGEGITFDNNDQGEPDMDPVKLILKYIDSSEDIDELESLLGDIQQLEDKDKDKVRDEYKKRLHELTHTLPED